jgi:hypothetical protein
MDHQNLEKQRGEQSEVREQTDLGIAPDDDALGIEDRKDHRHGDRGGIVKAMEKRRGDEDAPGKDHEERF